MKKNIIFILSIIITVGCLASYAQDTTRILIFDFQDISLDTSRFSGYNRLIAEMLATQLNGSAEKVIEADNYNIVANDVGLDPSTIVGIPANETLDKICDHFSNKYDNLVFGRFWYTPHNQINSEIYLYNARTQIQENQFAYHLATKIKGQTPKTEKEYVDELAQILAKQIESFLLSKIVLGILNFKMTDKDSANLFLEQSIPTILTSSLADSRRFRIKELKLEDIIDTMIKNNDSKKYLSTREIGEKYNLNYLIAGEYFELDGKIRIDARCISMATLEILFSDATIFTANDVEELSKQLNELATRMRISIEKDFNKREIPAKSIAVVAFPPLPSNRTTLLKSDYIRTTLLKKLRLVSELRVKDNPELTTKYLHKKEDKFKICSDLGVSNLISLEYDEFEDEPSNLDVDLFSIEKPYLELYRDSSPSNISLDSFLNQVVDTTLTILEITKPPISKIKEITIPTYLNRWTLGFRGANVNRANEQVYLSDGLGDYWELFLTFHQDARLSWEIILGYDFGKKIQPPNGQEARVSSTQLGFLINYKLLIITPINLYCGSGLSGFLVYRGFENNSGNTEEYGQFMGGITTLLGLEIEIRNIGLSLFIEPRYIFTGNIPEAQTSSGFIFPGGKLGGFYFTAGIGYNFNWPEWL